jgi:sulfur carrier protein
MKSGMQIFVNGNVMQLPSEAMTVLALVEHMQLTGKRIAVERNGDIVPRSQFPAIQLQGNDKLEIVGAVGGG